MPPRPAWPGTPVAKPAVAWFLALLASATFALDPAASFGRLGKALFPWLVPLAAFHLRDRAELKTALKALLVSSALAAAVGTIIFLAKGAGYPARARGPSGHYMTYGGQLLLAVSVAAGVAMTSREWYWRLGGLAATAVGGIALALTFTRSAWLGTAAALAVILAATRPRWIPVFAALLAVTYFAAPGTFRERLHSALDPQHHANRERTFMWDAGVRMFQDRPITGFGLQDLGAIYDRYRSPESHERAGHLHSVPVHIAATMGSAGLIAFVWLYGSLLVCACRGLRQDLAAGGPLPGLRVGVLGGLVGFFVAGLFEWNFGDEELLYLLFTLAGMAFSARGGGDPGNAPAARIAAPR